MTSSSPQRIRVFDTKTFGLSGYTGVFLIEGPEPVLVDAGTTDSAEALTAWLGDLGVVPSHVVVTHAHYDHVGGLGPLMRVFGAEDLDVLASPATAERLRDPVAANRLYGAEDLTPVHRVRAVQDGEIVRLGDLEMRFIWTPGHSADGLSVHDLTTNTLFPGDLPGDLLWGDTFLPPIAAEDFDEVAYFASMRRVAMLGAGVIALPHFGLFEGEEAGRLLDDQLARYVRWRDVLVGAHAQDGARAVEERVRSLLAGSRFESMPGWERTVSAFAGWCTEGLRHAGLIAEPEPGASRG